MDEITSCTRALVQAIQECEEYRQFCVIRDKVGENPELRRKINEFRRHVFEVQNSRELMDTYGEMERIRRDYEEFRRDPLVDEFLKSELRICRILQQVTLEIAGAVDLDTQDVAAGMLML